SAMRAALFDLTYAIGKPGRRGILLGEVRFSQADRAAAFGRRDDADAFGAARVTSIMAAWIAAAQDMARRPLSESTRRYLHATKRAAGWASVDVLATLLDLGVRVPEERLDDARRPSWRAFATWTADDARPWTGDDE